MNQQQRQCQIHEENLAFIDFSPSCDPQHRHCCAQCFTERTNFRYLATYKEANKLLETAKKNFKIDSESQIEKNLTTLQELINCISDLQNKQNSILDQLLENLKQKCASIKQWQETLDQKLQQLNIDQYFLPNFSHQLKGCDLSELQETILIEFKKLSENISLKEYVAKLAKIDLKKIAITLPLDKQMDINIGLKCNQHQEEIQFFNFEQQQEGRLLCKTCVNEKFGRYKTFEELQKLWKDYSQKTDSQLKEQEKKIIKQGQETQNELWDLQEKIISHLSQARDSISKNQTFFLQKNAKQISWMQNQWHHFSKEDVSKIVETLSKQEKDQILKGEIENSLQQYNVERSQILQKLNEQLCELQLFCFEKQKQYPRKQFISNPPTVLSTGISSFSNGNYQQVEQKLNTTQKEICYAIGFDVKNKMMIAGCESKIKIFKFENGQLVLNQIINEHSSNIVSLFVMNKTNNFISGSSGNSICIWKMDLLNWNIEQKIKQAHNGRVNCVIMNLVEDLIISCSDDKSIKFWRKQTKWNATQVLQVHQDKVLSISYNDDAKRLVSCGKDKQIVISAQTSDNFIVLQQLSGEWVGVGSRICFLASDLITYQPQQGKYMHIITINQQSKLFQPKLKLDIDEENDQTCFFPQMFIQNNQILVNKHHKSIYLISVQNEGQCQIEQKLNFKSEHIYGAITTDGEYLVTWDKSTAKFQVLKNQ